MRKVRDILRFNPWQVGKHVSPLQFIAVIVLLGIGAQWIAWRVHLPSILVLLLVGIVAGPVTGLLNPDAHMGALLVPCVSLSVGLILFEGGMSLKFAELEENRGAVVHLVTVGAVITWIGSGVAAYLLLEMRFGLAVLFGAIMTVTGPTVILPMLRHIRPSGRVHSVLKWEGIIIDPIGAVFAVLVLEQLLTGGLFSSPISALLGLVKTAIVGLACGWIGSAMVVGLFRRHLVPDHLQSPFVLMILVSTFATADYLVHESGLVAATAMGILLGNQRKVDVRHIVEFKETLTVLLIAGLFILLAARIDKNHILALNWVRHGAFLAVLILVIRPMAVFLSLMRSGLALKEKLFVSWMAPRGIVAAAMASLFVLDLQQANFAQVEGLVSATFFVIVGTVAVYGLTAPLLARWLGLSQRNPQGVLIVGAHRFGCELACALQEEGFTCVMVDSRRDNVERARKRGLTVFCANVLAESTVDDLDLGGLGRLLALTPNDEANRIAALRFREVFGRSEVYHFPSESRMTLKPGGDAPRLAGRDLFGKKYTYDMLERLLREGASIVVHRLSPHMTTRRLRNKYRGQMVPLFLITAQRELLVYTVESAPVAGSGDSVIALVPSTAISTFFAQTREFTKPDIEI